MGVAIFACVCIVFDIVTGLIKALYRGNLNSTALRKGLIHKVTELITLVGAYIIQQFVLEQVITFTLDVFVPIAIYIALMELVSVIENLSEVNPTLAKILRPYLEKLQKETKDDENRD